MEGVVGAHPELAQAEPMLWENAHIIPAANVLSTLQLSVADMEAAQSRWDRFKPLIQQAFGVQGGGITSELREIPAMARRVFKEESTLEQARVFAKLDSHLPVCGSVKARGGMFEVLSVAEDIAIKEGLLQAGEDYATLTSDRAKSILGKYTVAVGSTGNLGLSVGITAAVLGMKAVVHMSMDAKQWKKDRLRAAGVEVQEHTGDYNSAVQQGRECVRQNEFGHFVDDESSTSLFLGYSCAASELRTQLLAVGIRPSKEHPLVCYIPCGVGGAPGGICWGLKIVFGDAVCVLFAEPTHSPCVTLGLMTGQHSKISVRDIGLDNITEADGLAVARPSELCCQMVEHLLDGSVTVDDNDMFIQLSNLVETEGIFVEPSSAAVFAGPAIAHKATNKHNGDKNVPGLPHRLQNACAHVFWMTGGALVPEAVQREYIARGAGLNKGKD